MSSESFGEPSSPPSTPSTDHQPEDCEYHIHVPKAALEVPSRHSVDDKRRLRSTRKKRKRKKRVLRKVALKEQLGKERDALRNEQQATLKYKSMARSFWDRWRWELLKRKEAHRENLTRNRHSSTTKEAAIHHCIDPAHLQDPIADGKPTTMYIGRGSFSVVRVQLYRGILVAVKELLPRTLQQDVLHEANMLIRLCHPYLPYLLGICTSARPLRIVTQFHGIGLINTITLFQELQEPKHLSCTKQWILITTQLIEALCYLHSEVKMIHNDIKANNFLISSSLLSTSCTTTTSSAHASSAADNDPMSIYHAVLIDFGKATDSESGHIHHLNDIEKLTYLSRYPHIAPARSSSW